MPVIEVTIMEGRSLKKKEALIYELTEAAVNAICVPPQSVRVIIREVPPEHFGIGGSSKAKSLRKTTKNQNKKESKNE